MEIKDYITLTISVFAFILSVTSTVIAISRQKRQMRTTIRDQLANVVQEIITTLAENSVLQSEPIQKRDNSFYAKGSSYSHKLSSLARQATALIESVSDNIAFDVELSAVAQALDTVGDIFQADKYFERAIDVSPNDYYRIINMRLHAGFLFRQGKHQKGRKIFEDALAIFDDTSDFNKATNGYTYQFWFVTEVWAIPSPYGEAENCYKKAKGLYESISASSFRANCLQGLEAAFVTSPLAASSPAVQSSLSE